MRLYFSIPFFFSLLHPQSEYLHNDICSFDLGRQNPGRPRVREWLSPPLERVAQLVNPLTRFQHGFVGQVVQCDQVNWKRNKKITTKAR